MLKRLIANLLEKFAISRRRPMPHRYRPEKHYFRGPGPQWRAKHGRAMP